ncbi:MAG: MlaD family protein [Phycisphaerae bacterium]|nr:MlaD family protein [Phycisphaerae bacterium]
MQSLRRDVLVGVFVLLGLGGLGALAVLFGQNPTWLATSNTYALEIQFPAAGGIRAGNVVTVNGIQVGRVMEVGLFDAARLDADYNVRVLVAIDTKYTIPDGSTAVTNEPVFGQGRPEIRIEPGPSTNAALGPGARITGRVLGAVESIFPSNLVSTVTNTAEQIRQTGRALDPVLTDLHEILGQRTPAQADAMGEGRGNLSTAVARFDQLMASMTNLIGEPQTQSQLRDTITNLYRATEDGKEIAAKLKTATDEATALIAEARKSLGTVERTFANADARVTELGGRFNQGFGKLDTLLDGLNRVVIPLSRGEGTIGRLLTDNDLYEALVMTMQKLTATLTEYQALAREWQKGRVRVGL